MRRSEQSRIYYSEADTAEVEAALKQLHEQLAQMPGDAYITMAMREVSVALEALELRRRFKAMHAHHPK